MRIYLASAALDEVHWAAARGLLDGIVTTPAMLDVESGGEPRRHLAELCRLTGSPVFVDVHAVGTAEIYRDGRELSRLSDTIVVQVPMVEGAVAAMRRLHSEGIRVSATYVFSAGQALLAAKAGAHAVLTPLDQLLAGGFDGIAALREIRAVFDAASPECDLVALYPSTPAECLAAIIAGADAVAVTPELLRQLLVHPLTDRGVDQFLGELSRHHHGWSAP